MKNLLENCYEEFSLITPSFAASVTVYDPTLSIFDI